MSGIRNDFLHRIDLNNWHPCWNLRLTNILTSSNCTDFKVNKLGQHNPINKTSLSELEMKRLRQGFVQPRLSKVISKDKLWNLEMDFEKGRRKFCLDAPSRLASLYLVENNERGRKILESMFHDGRNIFLKARVLYFQSISKHDVGWFNKYSRGDKKEEYIEKYWRGIAKNEDDPNWEFLVDGIIEIIDNEGLDKIKNEGVFPPGYDESKFETFLSR